MRPMSDISQVGPAGDSSASRLCTDPLLCCNSCAWHYLRFNLDDLVNIVGFSIPRFSFLTTKFQTELLSEAPFFLHPSTGHSEGGGLRARAQPGTATSTSRAKKKTPK